MNDLSELEHELSAWPSISIHAHRFGGKEFRFGSAEVGHIHRGGTVDIPFPRPVHDVLLANGLAEEHRWVPNSGWVTFHLRRDQDLKHALWRSEEHTSELQSHSDLVCRLLLEKKKKNTQ